MDVKERIEGPIFVLSIAQPKEPCRVLFLRIIHQGGDAPKGAIEVVEKIVDTVGILW